MGQPCDRLVGLIAILAQHVAAGTCQLVGKQAWIRDDIGLVLLKFVGHDPCLLLHLGMNTTWDLHSHFV